MDVLVKTVENMEEASRNNIERICIISGQLDARFFQKLQKIFPFIIAEDSLLRPAINQSQLSSSSSSSSAPAALESNKNKNIIPSAPPLDHSFLQLSSAPFSSRPNKTQQESQKVVINVEEESDFQVDNEITLQVSNAIQNPNPRRAKNLKYLILHRKFSFCIYAP